MPKANLLPRKTLSFALRKLVFHEAKHRLMQSRTCRHRLRTGLRAATIFSNCPFRVYSFFRKFAPMKTLAVMLTAAALSCSCGSGPAVKETFKIETLNKTTPVKDQGNSPLCWVYGMLATIETDRLMQGDSVNLSPHYVARAALAELTERRYLTQGAAQVSADGVAPLTLRLMADYGAMPYDAYRSECNYDALCRKLTSLADLDTRRRGGIGGLRNDMEYMLDTTINPMPGRVWMYGMEYTPQQFAASVSAPSAYMAVTSYTHRPFYTDITLDLPANRDGCRFYNVPVDTLVSRVETALRSGRAVCWEGDVSNDGFSFADGVARLPEGSPAPTQAARQKAFETFDVTDDHCMALIGTARDSRGRRYYVCKNSWGTDNPYGGLMYMSEDYLRLNTIAVVMMKPGT